MEPKPPQFRLQNKEKTTEQHDLETSSQTVNKTSQEFASVEAMLRQDAAGTVPPDRIVERLKETLSKHPLPPASWWRRIWPW
jgi:hypothetical protein